MTRTITGFLRTQAPHVKAVCSDRTSTTWLIQWDDKHALATEAYDYGLSSRDVLLLLRTPGALLYSEPKADLTEATVLQSYDDVRATWELIERAYRVLSYN